MSKAEPAPVYPHLFRLLHWVLSACLVAAVATGLSLHAIARPGWSLFEGNLPRWMFGGQVQIVHLATAAVFFPALVAVLWQYWGRTARRRWTHLVLLGGGLAMIATGLTLANPVGPGWLYAAARAVHAVAGLAVLPAAFAWHAVEGLVRFPRLLVPAFHPWAAPRWRQVLVFVPLALGAACCVFCVLPAGAAGRELVAQRIGAAGEDLAALPWDDARPLRMALAGGVGLDLGRTEVTLRALHDGRELFLLAEWDDPTESRLYTPWEKTADGWRQLVTSKEDECVYYEDKLALAFPAQQDWRFDRFGCALYCHADAGRIYGYKAAGYVVDEWHWKAVRTDPVGRVDDRYWLGSDPAVRGVGRREDPSTGGGYAGNASKDGRHPAFLPGDPAVASQGMIPRQHAVPYSEEAAAEVPAGTSIPGVVAAAYQGDRGDVRCQSQYADGRWKLYIRRRLDTQSDCDVRFVPGASHPFACAAFDHTSNRHAYTLSAYRLVLAP